VSANPSGTTPYTFQHTYNQPALLFLIQVQATDDDGGLGVAPSVGIVVNPTFGNFASGHFVAQLYRDVLRREADVLGFNSWAGGLDAGRLTRTQVVAAFLSSPERLGVVVDSFYQQILHRGADPFGRAAWVRTQQNGVSEADVVVGLLTSREYTRRHVTNAAFAAGLYADIFNRSASPAELAQTQAALDRRAVSRAGLANQFLSSNEAFVRAIEEYYLGYLRRSPSQQERLSWFNILAGGHVTPNQVQTAFLASLEYLRFALTQPLPPGVQP
jgi:hypothetical protein